MIPLKLLNSYLIKNEFLIKNLLLHGGYKLVYSRLNASWITGNKEHFQHHCTITDRRYETFTK